jgi:DNA-binding transcriptional MerR regulator
VGYGIRSGVPLKIEEAILITGKEIVDELDIQSSRTLRRWADRDLLPKPTVKSLSTGRGRTSYWPDWVLPRCRRIRQLLKAGKSLDEIRDILGTNWKLEEAKFRKRYRFAEVSDDLDHLASVRNLAELIGNKLIPFLGGLGANVRDVMASLDIYIFKKETIAKLLELVRQGINPMLVYVDGQFFVTPDFMCGQLVGCSGDHDGPSIVIPIFNDVVTAFTSIEKDLPTAPTISLVPRVTKTVAECVDEFHVHPLGLQDFELSKIEATPAD